MNLKKLFSFQDGLTSFTYPVVKIVISLALLISAMLCARVADISNPLANLAFKVLYCVVAMACILCLIVSIHEFFSVISNRKTAHASPQDGKALTIQAVIDLTSRYDIIDIEACRGNETIRLGSSAESDDRDAPLKNKLFYISDTEYETAEQFEEALSTLFPNGSIRVRKIDDVPVKHWNLDAPPAK